MSSSKGSGAGRCWFSRFASESDLARAPREDPPLGPFDERRAGLDHVGFAVDNRGALDDWQARLADQGVEHSPVEDTASGSVLVFRDPDQIQLEMWWTKPRVG